MNSNDPRSIDFSYKKYSLQHLDEWINDAINCEDITPEEIYDTIVKAVDENIEYHKGKLTKNIEVLSLLKGHRPVDFDYTATGEKFPVTRSQDWEDFWNEQNEISKNYTEEDLNAMCDAAADKEKCREYNLREAEYYNKRAELDAQYAKSMEEIKVNGGYEWTPETTKEREMTYDDMVAAGWTMTADGFWIKE